MVNSGESSGILLFDWPHLRIGVHFLLSPLRHFLNSSLTSRFVCPHREPEGFGLAPTTLIYLGIDTVGQLGMPV